MDAWSGDPIPAQYLKGRTALERQGALVFQVKQCHNCHALAGVGGQRGPQLDRVAVALTEGSTHPPGDPGRRQHARLWKEPESRGDHRARGVPRDAASRPDRPRPVRRIAPLESEHIHRPMPFGQSGSFISLVLIAVAFVYLRGWYQLRNALPNFVIGMAPDRVCRVESFRCGSQ